jgi:hypothetical protein
VACGIDAHGTIYGLADRSAQMGPDGADGWPSVVLDLVDEMDARLAQRGALCEVGIEINTLGRAGVELLRAAERVRAVGAGRPAVSLRTIHDVTSRPRESKTRRAQPIVALAEGRQVRMVVGLGELERSLSTLDDEGRGSDAADAFVHGARLLAGLREAGEPDRAAAAIAAAAGVRQLNARSRAPSIGGRVV